MFTEKTLMQKSFLVLSGFALLARDVSATIEQMGLGIPLLARSEDEALSLLDNLEPGAAIPMAIMEMGPDDFMRSPLRAALGARGVETVLLSSSIEEATETPGLTVLSMPVFSEDLERLLRKLAGASGATDVDHAFKAVGAPPDARG